MLVNDGVIEKMFIKPKEPGNPAVANMQALTDRYGPSHKAFLIVPLVGAFFVDIINAFTLQGFMKAIELFM